MTNTLQQVRELSDMEYLAKMDKEHYDFLPLHEKFLQHFGEHQGMDGDYGEIDCGYEWNAQNDIPDIHEIAEWIDSESKVLPSEWIALSDNYPYDNTYVIVGDADSVDIAQGYASEYSGDWIWNCSKKWTHWMPLPLPHSP